MPYSLDRLGVSRALKVLHRKELLFLVVGGLNTALGIVLFAALHLLLGDSVPYLVVLVVTYAIGTVVAFTTQRLLVFRVEGQVATDFSRFLVVQLGAVALNAVLLTAFVEGLGSPVVPAQCAAVACVVVVSYYVHLHFSFHRPQGRGE